MSSSIKPAHEGFLRSSGIFLAMNFMYNIFELGFSWVSYRLPGNDYSTFWALLKIYFIVTAPLMAVQLVVSKEVASYSVLGEYGKRHDFVKRTGLYTMGAALAIFCAGLFLTPYIANFLMLDNRFPVYLVFIVTILYFPIPIFFGTIQGLKKFVPLGFAQMSWGFFRVFFAALFLFFLSGGLSLMMVAVILGIFLTGVISFTFMRSVFTFPRDRIGATEIKKAYGLIIPVIVMLLCVNVMRNIDLVLAKRFFSADPTIVKAYTSTSLIGSAFFTVTGIFLIMFPVVSEENTRGGNPIMFLVKSLGLILSLSSIGILIAWFFPQVPMYIITLGKVVPGAEPLIKLIGIAVLPVSLIFLLSNYFLAKHQWGFLAILVIGMIIELVCIGLIHDTPVTMLYGIMSANWVTFIVMFGYLVYGESIRKEG